MATKTKSKTTITLAILTALATEYSPGKAFKPYWANKDGVTFYAFLAAKGYDGAAIVSFKTSGGYVNTHVTYPAKATVAAGRPIAAKRTRTTEATAPAQDAAMANLMTALRDAGILA